MRALSLLVAASLPLAACDLAPEGDDDGQNMAESTTCELTEIPLGSADEVSPLVGMSGNDLLAALSSPYAAAAIYPDNDATGQSPAPGSETELTLTIEYAGGPVAEVDATLVQGQDEMWVECHPFLAVEVSIGIVTDDGAFDESWTGRLVGYAADVELPPEIRIGGLELEELQGTFQIGAPNMDEELEAGDMELTTDLDPTGPSGEIAQYYTFESGEGEDAVAGQMIYRLLTWGEGY